MIRGDKVYNNFFAGRSAACLLLLVCFIHISVLAQDKEFTRKNFKKDIKGYRKALTNISRGDYYYMKGDHYYRYAIPFYLNAEKFNPDNAMLNYKLGKCMIFSGYKNQAIAYMEQAIVLNASVAPDIHYYMARAYHLDMNWDKAIQEYNTYLQSLPPDKKAELADVHKKIEECNNGKLLCQSPVRVFIDNLGDSVNSSYPEYHPLISTDESKILFTSRSPVISRKVKLDPRDGEGFENLYISYNKNGIWSAAQKMNRSVNVKLGSATAGLSPDGKTLYLYRTTDNGDIYESHFTKNSWARPERMNRKVNSVGKESSITITADGKTMYFVSDRSGGYGLGDIYVTTLDNKGNWSAPKNLGPTINTQYDEQGVFVTPDGHTLYFSSTGHNTMGGYDIFKSVYDSGHWSTPVNLGYPINTPGDDIFFTMPADNKHAYYSSDQKGGKGDMDIYMITFLGPEKPVVVSNNSPATLSGITPDITDVLTSEAVLIESNKALIRGMVVDSDTHKPLYASVQLIDNKKNKVIANFNTDSITGEYVVSLSSGINYDMAVKAPEHLFYSANIDLTDSSHYHEMVKNIALQPLEIGRHIALRNIFFDFNKSTLRKESTPELQEVIDLLKQHPTITIEISGYTDNKGTDKYNLNLSTARAKSVVTYLVAHGISAKRLTYKGYGAANPVASNATDAGRQLNRRTEFKITGK